MTENYITNHSVIDSDISFYIDPFTRQISSDDAQKYILMRGDHHSERFTFKMPRYIEGHDMAACNSVMIHFINAETAKKKDNGYITSVDSISDLEVCKDDDTMVTFSWLVDGNATIYAGVLKFGFTFKCLDGTKVLYSWGTDIYNNIKVLDSISADLSFEIDHIDAIAKWKENFMLYCLGYIASDVERKGEEVKRAIAEYVDAETRSLADDINVLESRMNTFTSLPNGSTTGDAELIDGRIDYTGKKWNNIGEHIRGISDKLIYKLDDNKRSIANTATLNIGEACEFEGVEIEYELTNTHGYINKNGTVSGEGDMYYNYTFIPVHEGENYLIRSALYKNIVPYVFVSADGETVIPYIEPKDASDPTVYDITTSFLVPCDGTLYVNYYRPGHIDIRIFKIEGVGLIREDKLPESIHNGNILYGKKWAVCGDSFTHGDFSNALDTDYYITEEGPYKGQYKVYGYLIGNRNNMRIQHLAVGGRTMATPADGSFTNAFSNNMYKDIDADVDYITLYFGINDSHHRPKSTGTDGEDKTGIIELGTIDDTDRSTFYGAWNVVIKYLIENYPNAHIGIIVSNGCETSEYPEAEIAIAKKWGLPYIDLNGDERTPMMNRSTNVNATSAAKEAKSKAFSVNYGVNGHPSAKAHEYESSFIENFLRSI